MRNAKAQCLTTMSRAAALQQRGRPHVRHAQTSYRTIIRAFRANHALGLDPRVAPVRIAIKFTQIA